MHSTISRSLAAVILSLTPLCVSGQTPGKPADSQDPIPRELALALLNLGPGMRGGSTDIRIGKAPDDVPAELLAPGLQILGSTSQFGSAVIILAAPQPPDSAISIYESHLLSSGWTKPPVPKVQPMRGFVSADMGQIVYERPDLVCKGDEFVTFSGTYRRTTGSLVKVTYNRGREYSMCKNRQDTSGFRSPYDEAPIPLLRAPFGSSTLDGNSMGASGNNSFTLSTRLTTRLKPDSVVTHYDKQMHDQGWMSATVGSLPSLSARTYRKSDDQGRQWVGLLFSVAMPDSTQQEVTFRLTRTQASVAK